jgi:ribosomal protein S26
MKYEIINYDYYYECKRCKLIMPRDKIIYSLKTHNKIYNNIKGFNEDA